MLGVAGPSASAAAHQSRTWRLPADHPLTVNDPTSRVLTFDGRGHMVGLVSGGQVAARCLASHPTHRAVFGRRALRLTGRIGILQAEGAQHE